MKYYNHIEDYNDTKPAVVTLGKFDGLHRGHQKLIDCVTKQDESLVRIVCAFDMQEFNKSLGQDQQYLMIGDEKQHFLAESVDALVECEFTNKLQQMSVDEFVETILVKTFHAKVIVVGEEFRFGYQKKGDTKLLQLFGEKLGFKVIVVEREYDGIEKISSSTIKDKIKEGKLDEANELLGYPYFLEGKVESGRQLGRTLGFPTMNVYPKEYKVLPPSGVYICYVFLDGIKMEGIVNIGVKPTISKEPIMTAEVHVFNFNQDRYGSNIKVEFICFLRGEQKFESVEILKQRVHRDMKTAISFFDKD